MKAQRAAGREVSATEGHEDTRIAAARPSGPHVHDAGTLDRDPALERWPARFRPAPAKAVLQSQEPTFERHYSVEELCDLWQMSDDFVRRLFLREPGVVVFYHQRPGKR